MDVGQRWRHGEAVRARAVDQLAAARTHRDELAELADVAEGTPREASAADARDAARARATAKEAWVHWLEHGF